MLIRKAILTFLLLLFSQMGLSQYQPPQKWRVGYFGEIDYTGNVGVPGLSQDTFPTEFSNSSAWDSSGNMIIHTNGIAVFDANMDTMPGGLLEYNVDLTLPQFGSNITQAAIILPRPGYNKQFLLFHIAADTMCGVSPSCFGKLFYSLIDLNLNNGLGAITTINVEIEDSLWIGYINAVQHGNGRDWWLVCGRNYSNLVNSWLIQPDTISTPIAHQIGLSITWPEAVSQTQFSPNGSQFAIAYAEHVGLTQKFLITDFNRCTGIFSGANIIQLIKNDPLGQGIWGIEFSQSGRFLYAATPTYLYQYDLLSSNIQNSKILVSTHDHVQAPFQSGFCYFKRGPDGKIYMATGAGNYAIDVINNPDSLGLACDVQLRQINYFAQFGATYAMNILVMPLYPDYNLGALTGSPCDTITSINVNYSPETSIEGYPNPTMGLISLEYSAIGEEGQIEIYDVLGKVIFMESVSPWSSSKNINLSYLRNGIYFCRLNWKSKSAVIKIVVNH